MSASAPQDIARETVKHLAARKLPPTPENFTTVYHEVAGTRPLRPFPLEQLRRIESQLPVQTVAQQRVKNQFAKAVTMHSWDDLEKVLLQHLKPNTSTTPTTQAQTQAPSEQDHLPEDLSEQLARIISFTLPALGQDDPKCLAMGDELVKYLKQDSQHLPTLRKKMADFAFRLSFVAEDQARIRELLLGLLRSVYEHIQAINPENPWLQGQLDALIQATQPPLALRRLEDVERRLKSLILKQTEAQEQAAEAQRTMKDTLSAFLQKLSQTTQSSEQYQQRFEDCTQKLQQARSIADMAPVLENVIQTTRSLAMDSRQTSDELNTLRSRAEQAELEIQKLREALDQMSAMASHDLLTGALNRQGMNDVMERELARADRAGTTVCVALLDIDDFKRLNDRLGHLSGDAALKHLAEVAKASLRPHDSVARYGGEEFVVVLPDTAVAEAGEVLNRMQRELTKLLFFQGNERVLITFSAGVVQVQANETMEQALHRADQAMYSAKRSGKNRVVVA